MKNKLQTVFGAFSVLALTFISKSNVVFASGRDFTEDAASGIKKSLYGIFTTLAALIFIALIISLFNVFHNIAEKYKEEHAEEIAARKAAREAKKAAIEAKKAAKEAEREAKLAAKNGNTGSADEEKKPQEPEENNVVEEAAYKTEVAADTELAAVITAAVYSYLNESGEMPVNGILVRSIKRVKRAL
jgi:uncharacterized membrane protein